MAPGPLNVNVMLRKKESAAGSTLNAANSAERCLWMPQRRCAHCHPRMDRASARVAASMLGCKSVASYLWTSRKTAVMRASSGIRVSLRTRRTTPDRWLSMGRKVDNVEPCTM